jgi:hypothetical protein
MRGTFVPVTAIAVLLLAVVGSVSSRSPVAPAGDPAPAATGAESKKAHTDEAAKLGKVDDALALVGRFLGLDPAQKEPDLRTIDDQLARRKMPRLRMMIALVPDPIDSHYAHMFDQAIEAIRGGLETLGYVADRYASPWTSADGQLRKDGAHRINPGTLLFHRRSRPGTDPNPGEELLVVALVGEAPTWGIERGAFSKAFNLAYSVAQDSRGQIQSGPDKTAVPTVKILGPSFSGSSLSLQITITDLARKLCERTTSTDPACPPTPTAVEIISGAATSSLNVARLQTELNQQLAADAAGKGHAVPLEVDFHAAVVTDDEASRVALDYLEKGLGADPRQIALLAESMTAYSQDLLSFIDENHPYEYRIDPVNVRRVRFPLHISQLRSAYADEHRGADAQDTAGGALPKRFLEPTLDDPHTATDEFPAVSAYTRSSAELALASILQSLASSGVRYVAILASDSRDTIFLSEEIRKFFPDVQILIFSYDLSYLHDDLSSAMAGSLVVSTYPPFAWAQDALFPHDGGTQLRMFPSEYAEGIYNSIVMLLDDPIDGDPIDYHPPFMFAGSGAPLRPHPWISVIGTGDFYPVYYADGCAMAPFGRTDTAAAAQQQLCYSYVQPYTRLELDAPQEKRERARINAILWRLPRAVGFDLMVLVTALFAGGFGIAFFAAPLLDSQRWRFFSAFVPSASKGPTHRWHVSGFILVVVLMHMLLMALSAIEFVSHMRVRHECMAFAKPVCDAPLRPLFLTLPLILIVSMSFLLCDLALSRMVRTHHERRSGESFAILGVSTAVVLGLCAVYGWWLVKQGIGSSDAITDKGRWLMFFFDRARNLSSGVSLLTFTVLIGAAWLLWIVGHLRKADIIECGRHLAHWLPHWSKDWDRPGFLEHRIRLAIRSLSDRIARPFASLRSTIAVGVVVLVAAAFVRPSLLMPFEGRFVYWASQVVFWTVLASCLIVFERLLATWYGLRRVTTLLSVHPLRDAFGRVSPETLDAFNAEAVERCDLSWRDRAAMILNRWNASTKIQKFVSSLPLEMTAIGGGPAEIVRDEGKLLTQFWRRRPVADDSEPGSKPSGVTDAKHAAAVHVYTSGIPDEGGLWIRLWEDLLASRMAFFISYVKAHLYNYLGFITVCLIAVMLAGSGYPFQGNRLLFLVLWGAMLSIIAGVMLVLLQMSRDEILSRITRTEPGKVTWDRGLISGALVHAALPLLGIIAVRFPQVGGRLFAWADPLVKMFSR